MISHFRLASSQSTGEALPSTKTFPGSLQALLSCVQSCPGWCEDTGLGEGLHHQERGLGAASIDSRQDVCWHFVGWV